MTSDAKRMLNFLVLTRSIEKDNRSELRQKRSEREKDNPVVPQMQVPIHGYEERNVLHCPGEQRLMTYSPGDGVILPTRT